MFQCLRYENRADIEKIILTALEGLKMSVAEMQKCVHRTGFVASNWSMG